jgi:hypothetical protein
VRAAIAVDFIELLLLTCGATIRVVPGGSGHDDREGPVDAERVSRTPPRASRTGKNDATRGCGVVAMNLLIGD